MKEERESRVIAEVRRIRRAHQERARRIGRRKYLEELNRKRGWVLGKARDRGKEYPDMAAPAAVQVKEPARPRYGKEQG